MNSDIPVAESLDQVLEQAITQYRQTGRLDGVTERLRVAMESQLSARDIEPGQRRIIEVNILGNLAGWVELVIEQRAQGRNLVPDFARNLQHIFIAHCRRHEVPAQVAIDMAIELSGAILEIALAFQRHMSLTSVGSVNIPTSGPANKLGCD